MMMKPLVVITVYVSLLLLRAATATTPPPSRGTCKSEVSLKEACRAAESTHHAIKYDYCMKVFKSDKRSQSADMHGLAAIGTKLAIAMAMSSEAKLGDMMDVEFNDDVCEAYQACIDFYNDAIDHLRDALDNLNSKLYGEATSLLGAALDAGDHCEEAFKKVIQVSPLGEEDKEYSKIAETALALASLIE